MSTGYLEKRIIKAGLALCRDRIREKGTMIRAEDIRALKVNTMPPGMRGVYYSFGSMLMLAGVFVQYSIANMGISMALVFVGILNFTFGTIGRMKRVGDLEGEVDLMSLMADIVSKFVAEQEPKK